MDVDGGGPSRDRSREDARGTDAAHAERRRVAPIRWSPGGRGALRASSGVDRRDDESGCDRGPVRGPRRRVERRLHRDGRVSPRWPSADSGGDRGSLRPADPRHVAVADRRRRLGLYASRETHAPRAAALRSHRLRVEDARRRLGRRRDHEAPVVPRDRERRRPPARRDLDGRGPRPRRRVHTRQPGEGDPGYRGDGPPRRRSAPRPPRRRRGPLGRIASSSNGPRPRPRRGHGPRRRRRR
mmetsp:Transcript_8571/g.28089  ORF Transcript_8571/g.28089 Transcript_8571/m.28089 type:complete len:241 (-) Transcript_8571:42-764(-)